MFVALIYVGRWTPGEIIGEELTEAQAERLLKMGAIRRTDAPEPATPAPETECATEAPVTAKAQEAEEEEVEAPVIDVADTLATAPSAPKKKGGRRK